MSGLFLESSPKGGLAFTIGINKSGWEMAGRRASVSYLICPAHGVFPKMLVVARHNNSNQYAFVNLSQNFRRFFPILSLLASSSGVKVRLVPNAESDGV